MTEFLKNIDKKPIIYLIDDIRENVIALEKFLELNGFECAYFSNAHIALLEIKKNIPDLILLDINMPDMNGFEMCRLLRDSKNTNEIPVIFLTAMTDKQNIIEGFKSGGKDYVTKPFSLEEVLARVSNHLELKLTRDQNKEIIQELENSNNELLIAQKELKELNSSKDKFFSIIAHDLKNPFHGFMGLTQLLMTDLDDFTRKDIGEVVYQMNKSANKLYKLLDNLLTWSRIQMGRMEFIPLLNNLYNIIKNGTALYNDIAVNKNITINIKIPENFILNVDKLMIDTVIRNLISNALKFSHENSEIDIYLQSDEEFVDIFIQDYGLGMSDYDKSLLFKLETSFSKKGTKNEAGTGLGLILCKELVEKNGGSISINSVVGEGTTFRVRLPLNPELPNKN